MAHEDPSPAREKYDKTRSGVSKFFSEARVFWETRRAVLRGEALWENSSSKPAESTYFGPWKFNAVQTAIAGGFAATTTKAINLVLPPSDSKEPKAFADDPVLSKLFETTWGWIEPFVLPIFLTAFVALMGWGSLKQRDSTPQTRARARAAYLYLDGAHGFWPQLILAFLVAAFSSQLPVRFAETVSSPGVLWPMLILLLVLVIWQFSITAGKIPKLLFFANGYSSRARRFWQVRKPDDPPWGKLVGANLLAAWPLQIAVAGSAFGLAFGLASFLKWLQKVAA